MQTDSDLGPFHSAMLRPVSQNAANASRHPSYVVFAADIGDKAPFWVRQSSLDDVS